MLKIIAASAIGLALIAGQAVASNGSAQALGVGDRVGADLGQREDMPFGTWLQNGGFFGGSGVGGALITTIIFVAIAVPVIDEIVDDEEASPST